MRIQLLILSCCFSIAVIAQNVTTPEELQKTITARNAMASTSLVKNLKMECIGPAIMSGRVVDLAVNNDNPNEFFVAYASGGLWHTNNNGTSFKPVLDNADTQNIGDIAVDWRTKTIWVGTGENNASRSSYAGIGLLKSKDFGKTWQNMGLSDAHHIGRIVINPKNPDEVVVGVTGHLYTPNKERGVYKTFDGGKTWQQTLFIDENTGIIDVAYDPTDFYTQYAAAWQKDRKAWNFNGNGASSGLYKSTDGGANWTLISTPESGLPIGEGVGRMGIAVFDENTVYVVHDSQFRRTKESIAPSTTESLQKNDFKTMSKADFLALDNKKLNDYLKNYGFHEKYRANNVKNMVKEGAITPIDLASYLENANSLLFDTPVIGPEVYRSDDAGKTWTKKNTEYINDLFYSYGYYFGQIRVNPQNKEHVYLAGVPLIKSEDGGTTFSMINKENVHADHHALWINPNRPSHLINGNDGGVNITYDDGDNWVANNSTNVGQFYAINIDFQEPYNVYGGLQDNGVWMGAHNNEQNKRWEIDGQNPWKKIMGGDGMQVQIDKRDANTVYTGFQFGNYFRLDVVAKKRTYIQPKHNLGEAPFRFNWQTPILLSSHNQDILYMGSNKLHRSLNQGDNWETISNDLTNGGKKGNVAYGTITTISESPFAFGLIYVGTDDGLVQVLKDGKWSTISNTLPKNLWVSEVAASKHKKERVYVTLNGYRNDDFTAYIYKSEDYGKTWKSIGANIPNAPVNAFVEDTENENLLFVGTDAGMYVSFNRGETWEILKNGLPNVAIHDLVIQPEAKDLLIGTHGRSIYKADIAVLQQFTASTLNSELHVFEVPNIKHSKKWGNSQYTYDSPSTPGLDISFFASTPQAFTVAVKTAKGIHVSNTQITAEKGLNILSYDVAFSPKGKGNYQKKYKTNLKEADDGKTYLPKGSYVVVISGDRIEKSIEFEIE